MAPITTILLASLLVTVAGGTDASSSWHRFGSNENYRITAILDVNGGATEEPAFEYLNVMIKDDASSKTKSTKTPGYSIPIDVLTLRDPKTGTYRQRISYYSGMQVDYNVDGQGFKVVPTPFAGVEGGSDDDDKKKKTCLYTEGSSTSGDEKDKVGYLNFFPTVEQMELYTLGKLITSEPGVPYRIATLEAPHGSYESTTPGNDISPPDASYDDRPGMPSNDWFEFRYEETSDAAGRPLMWTMLARNQIINAHTEEWVLRYLSYEAIGGDDGDEEERKTWEGLFDAKFARDCGDDVELVEDLSRRTHANRLGMFFSASSTHRNRDPPGADVKSPASAVALADLSEFDLFLARNNRNHNMDLDERSKRKAIHDMNVEKVAKWNEIHAGKTRFAANEFMDMEVKEVMKIRGGHVPRGSTKRRKSKLESDGRRGIVNEDEEERGNLRRSLKRDEEDVDLSSSSGGDDGASSNDDEDDDGDYAFTQYQLPEDFDVSTLPESFDWREHLPGSVGAIKDQGFCGSCWAFSFVSAVESHWFIANGQSVDLPEQFVNDCGWPGGNAACDGGDASAAAGTVINDFGGKLPTRDAYGGYLSVDGVCYVDILKQVGVMDVGKDKEKNDERLSSSLSTLPSAVQLTDWVVLPPRNDFTIKHALYYEGPLSVALNIVDEALYYSSGVLDVEACTKNGENYLDHAVNLVGWGVDELPDGSKAEHWILRNSWSDLWGDSGYFRVRMGDRDCGITTSAGFPVVAGKAELGSGKLAEVVAIS